MRIFKTLVFFGFFLANVTLAAAQAPQEQTLSIEERLRRLEAQLKAQQSTDRRFHLGGYGEIHGNFKSGGGDQVDFHRLVFYVGYDFSNWIKFSSEIELEHAFVSDGSDGEVALEQGYVDFLLDPKLNVRIGRFLTPLGIINQHHEPPSFNGVERPVFSKYIIPTTWPSDGIGVFGRFSRGLQYEFYIAGGLDGSGFDPVKGIRGGRITERPSLNDPAIMGRIDVFPLELAGVASDHLLRTGISVYAGGINNGNEGDDPDVSGDISILSADFEYTYSRLDLKGVVAWEKIDDKEGLKQGVADEILGWYLEGAVHWLPNSWKKGRLAKSDSTVFLRYEDIDTQYRMPQGVEEDPKGERSVWTTGIGFYPVPNLVLKMDYQIVDYADSSVNDEYKWNVGIGWQF
ncbi:hypothetical protein DBT_0438 [Dissulfuribacter thermophilus]|uniref:Phosphate-selective porin O and P n=1 Tax=Dissulfuribacter thermophilus TaxID=1156395 RepID=A0A1B9F7T3_9BACT|nr:hypothetical protein [Dissulfuribacter thermophilus]OCC15976.1 hypothetical protein DBT_0438 [Dissulfuribacter thermophilus]